MCDETRHYRASRVDEWRAIIIIQTNVSRLNQPKSYD